MKKIRVLFIHHSTGGLLLMLGKVRKLLTEKAPNIKLWDHGYNLFPLKWLSYLTGKITFKTGLSDGNGKMIGKDFNIEISNSSPKEYADIFSRDKSNPTLSEILKFDVIIFKNCFPTSKIETTEKLEKYKEYYLKIVKSIFRYPNLFILFTPPPVRRESTNPVWAENARKLADWLKTATRIIGSKNIAVFDFFDKLADKEGPNKNRLKREYCFPIVNDSHPNIRANQEVGKLFVDFLIQTVNKYFKF